MSVRIDTLEGTYDEKTKTLTLNSDSESPDGKPMKMRLETQINDDGTRVMTAVCPDGRSERIRQIHGDQVHEAKEVTSTRRCLIESTRKSQESCDRRTGPYGSVCRIALDIRRFVVSLTRSNPAHGGRAVERLWWPRCARNRIARLSCFLGRSFFDRCLISREGNPMKKSLTTLATLILITAPLAVQPTRGGDDQDKETRNPASG